MILALDIGFRVTGYALFENGKLKATGVIETAPSEKKTVRMADDNAYRSAQIAFRLRDLVKQYKIKAVVGELPPGGAKSARAMSQMALATGTIAATFALLGLPVEWVSPFEVKLAVTGKKSATKDEIMDAITVKYGKSLESQKGKFEHIADAIGAYLAAKEGNLVRIYG
jgi:Holliday junction resolvasome RuvABC endonuclease subunit